MEIDITKVVFVIDVQREVVKKCFGENSNATDVKYLNDMLNCMCLQLTNLYARGESHVRIDEYVHWLMGEESMKLYNETIQKYISDAIKVGLSLEKEKIAP